MLNKISQYYNTVKYLRPVQITGQLMKLFVLKSKISTITKTLKFNPLHLATIIPSLDMNEEYLSRFDVDRLMWNEITLLNETHKLNLTTWQVEASPLWRFNLHYFEYAISLAARYHQTTDLKYYRKFKELLGTWMAAIPVGIGDGWHPYTISMRIPNLLICFDFFGKAFETDVEFRNKVFESIYAQYRTLIKRKELWQLGNHYFENLKTILLGSLLFGETKVFDKYIRLFLRELDEEILSDGVHFELSVMYHKIILEDVLRVAYWLRQGENLQYKELLPVIQKMVNAMASLEQGMGKTPFFNDSADGVAKECYSLLRSARELFAIDPVYSEEFMASGYYKLYDGNIALMLDVGEIGPKYMAGHGHCDCLSYELSVGGVPLVVNAGTYQYQGELRKYFRSTKAHNTLMVGDEEQSECWGEHRVARRISDVRASKKGQLITGSYKSYVGNFHTRMTSLVDSTLTVLDTVKIESSVRIIHSYLHIADGYTTVADDTGISINLDNHIICRINTVDADYVIHTTGAYTQYSPKFGQLFYIDCIEFSWQSDGKQHGYVIQIY